MDCPRCGARLTRISLNGERQSVYCERCRFADIESDHTRASAAGETWDDALRRFRTDNAERESEENVDAETGSEDVDGDETGSNAVDGDVPDRNGERSADDDEPPDGTDGADATADASDSESDRTEDAETEEA
jgi:hypothetical protein